MASPQVLFDPGLCPTRSNVSVYQEVNECMMLMVSRVCSDNNVVTSLHTSTPELVVTSSEGTLNVKYKTSKKRTLDTNLSKTSGLVSTSRDTACVPFWNKFSPGWSARLLSCIKTDLQELATTCWTSSAQSLGLNSWFTVKMTQVMTTPNSQKTCLQSPLTSSPRITDVMLQKIEKDESKNNKTAGPKRQKLSKKEYEHPVRARKIRIHPTEEQRIVLDKWFGSVRFCYNQLVGQFQSVGQGGVNLAVLRKVVKDVEETKSWLKDIPGEIKDVAVRDFDKARTTHFAKLKKKRLQNVNARLDSKFKFRTKRDRQQSFEVRARDMVRDRGNFAFINLKNVKSSEKLPSVLEGSVRFIRDRLNRYYLIIPRQVKRNEKQVSSDKTVSLDPGVRTFQTTYDTEGLVTEWGNGDMKQIFRLCKVADKVQSEFQKKKGSKRRSTKRAWYRIMDKIKNRVKDVHCKMSKWLCEEYRVILIPKFESSRMVRRVQRKINSKTARSMLTWSHYTFREMLKAKAELYSNVTVIECDEAYTSKTCGNCGKIHQTLSGSKVFKCKHCEYESDRDINAARNIMLRYLSLKVGEGSCL